MYHPRVVESRLASLLPKDLRPLRLTRDGSWEQSAALQDLWNPDTKSTVRPLTTPERAFVRSEQLLCKCDFRYWTRYAWISGEGREVVPLVLWDSQELVLDKIAELEWERWKEFEEHGFSDGVLVACLKARQEGVSTLSQAMAAHRLTCWGNLFGLVAADVPDQSAYIFDMLERIVDHLPWFLNPGVTEHVKNSEIKMGTGSAIWVGSGKSVRGTTGSRGELARGRTLSTATLTEVSTWEAPHQIDTALLPAIPMHPMSLVILESTAKGRNNYWHALWKNACAGVGRFKPVFVPWYSEPTKYRLPPPPGWTPSPTTLVHAARCAETSPTWLGRKVDLSPEQLYWYERTRAAFDSQDRLHDFLTEYPAEPEESFQHSSRSIIPAGVLQKLDERKRPMIGVIEVLPGQNLVKPLETLTHSDPDPAKIPAGYGLRPLPRSDWPPGGPLALAGLLLIWELPRPAHRYVVSVDTSSGMGLDWALIDVVRVGTLAEPEEQVAQWYSREVTEFELAKVADVVGKFYHDGEGLEAMMAVECNGAGIATQNELQQHLGYTHFFVWQFLDAADQGRKFSTRVGWFTSNRTRPMILSKLKSALLVRDARGEPAPDFLINSPLTLDQLRDFQTDGALWEAEAARGANDDAVMTAAIGLHVSTTLHYEAGETLADQRRRTQEERLRGAVMAKALGRVRDYQNTDCAAPGMYTAEQLDEEGEGEEGGWREVGEDLGVEMGYGWKERG